MTAKKTFFLLTGFFLVLALISAVIALLQREMPLRDRVALVRIEGPIISSKAAVEEIKGYAKDKSIKAIVLRVESPGGGVVASQEIHNEVKKAADVKKVVVSMGYVAASGGYYVSVPASQI